jgi:acetyl-CoA acyltransferase
MTVAYDIAITGVGMTPFGRHLDRSLKSLGAEAVTAALRDARLSLEDLDAVFVANAMASIVTGQVSVVGQTIMRDMGVTATPVWNIDNACAGSSSAVTLAMQAIRSGAADNVLVLGVEKLFSPDRTASYRALNGAADVDLRDGYDVDFDRESFFVKAVYPQRFRRYADRFGLDAVTLARISVKNRAHASHNPMAQYRDPMSVEQVLASRVITGPLHALMCAPIGDGAAALVLSAAAAVDTEQRPVWVRASHVAMGGTADGTALRALGAQAYATAGITPERVDVAEVHDSISFNELRAYEELGWCAEGDGPDYLDAARLGGRRPVNVSGGLESRGHPVAATGAAQLVELVQQLRHDAGPRQVQGARWALAENAGGFAADDTAALAVTILEGDV